MEPPGRRAPGRGRLPGLPPRGRPDRPRRRGGRPPGRAAGHRPRGAAARGPARRRRAAADLRHDRAARRRRAAGRPAPSAGVLWGDVIDPGRPRRARGAAHVQPGVGVVGSSLGGGVGWYARQHGLQCSAITAVELVLADGTFVRATDDAGRRPALGGPRRQRRLRGGHRARVRPAAGADGVRRHARVGLAARPARAPRVGRLGADAPESVTSVARMFQVPDIEWLPDQLRGRKLVMIDAVVLGDPETGARVLAPLRALQPEIDTFAEMPARRHRPPAAGPEEPTAVYASSILVAGFPAGAVDALVEAAGPESGSNLLFVELRQLGGALARPVARAAARWTGSRRLPRARRRARRRHRVGRRPRGRRCASWPRSQPWASGRRTSRCSTRPRRDEGSRRRRTRGCADPWVRGPESRVRGTTRVLPATDSAARLKSASSPVSNHPGAPSEGQQRHQRRKQ